MVSGGAKGLVTMPRARARRVATAVALVVLVGLPLPALGVPALQLFIPGATYDTTTQTWVTVAPVFSLWVVGSSQKGKLSLIEDLVLDIAELPSPPGVPVLKITNSNSVSTTLTAADFTLGKPARLAAHGIYPAPFATYSVRDLLVGSAGVLVQDFVTGGPTDFGDIEKLTVENLGHTGLHFDVTGTGITTKGGTKFLFANFAHDAEATVPEPGTLLLLGSGLTGLAAHGWRRLRNRRNAGLGAARGHSSAFDLVTKGEQS